jgi:hypothetical protein
MASDEQMMAGLIGAKSRVRTRDQLFKQLENVIKGQRRQINRQRRTAGNSESGLKTAARTAAEAIPFMSRWGGLPGIVLGAVSYPLIMRMLDGSPEEQMRRQYKVQEELENERMMKSGGDMGGLPAAGGSMPAGMMQQEVPMSQLMAAEEGLIQDNSWASSRNRTINSLVNPSGSSEMRRLLAGDEARIRSAISERPLTPYEIMQVIDG